MTRGQMMLLDDEALWEMGVDRRCPYAETVCRYEPCTVANEVRCCRECMMCSSPCGIAKGKEKGK